MVHSIVGEQIEKRFIAGHFSIGDVTRGPETLFVKGYFLSPSSEIDKDIISESRHQVSMRLGEVLDEKVCENFNNLGQECLLFLERK
ncbi:MAG: hypothetical protein NTY99_01005 [DPANN group archaeon]|nr:hypothetical protein [DPANN group archaeon]